MDPHKPFTQVRRSSTESMLNPPPAIRVLACASTPTLPSQTRSKVTASLLGRINRRSSSSSTYIITRPLPVASTAMDIIPTPAAKPIAADNHRPAAVVSPLTTSLLTKMRPASRNPTPLTTWAATREGSKDTFGLLRLRNRTG